MLIAGHRQFIARAHAQGLKIIGCTLLPFGKSAVYYSAAAEAGRQGLNAFIRSGGEYDGVIDFDAVMRDPAAPQNMLDALNSGDGLHPNAAGYQVMANAVNMSLFQ